MGRGKEEAGSANVHIETLDINFRGVMPKANGYVPMQSLNQARQGVEIGLNEFFEGSSQNILDVPFVRTFFGLP